MATISERLMQKQVESVEPEIENITCKVATSRKDPPKTQQKAMAKGGHHYVTLPLLRIHRELPPSTPTPTPIPTPQPSKQCTNPSIIEKKSSALEIVAPRKRSQPPRIVCVINLGHSLVNGLLALDPKAYNPFLHSMRTTPMFRIRYEGETVNPILVSTVIPWRMRGYTIIVFVQQEIKVKMEIDRNIGTGHLWCIHGAQNGRFEPLPPAPVPSIIYPSPESPHHESSIFPPPDPFVDWLYQPIRVAELNVINGVNQPIICDFNPLPEQSFPTTNIALTNGVHPGVVDGAITMTIVVPLQMKGHGVEVIVDQEENPKN